MGNSALRPAVIVGANRIPFARSGSAYAQLSNQNMLTAALNGLVDRFDLAGETLGEVAAGAVLKHSRDFNLTRECVLGSKLAPDTPAYDIQQACGTGLEALILVANKIALGQIEVGVAGGADTTSDAPIEVSRGMQRGMMAFNHARSNADKLRALAGLAKPSNLIPAIPANSEPRTGLSMGEHCELTAQRWHIARADQDRLAWDSHQKLAAAYEEGFFDDLITPHAGLSRDNNLRPDSTLEKLASLKPAYQEGGTLTAANSTPLTDGASCVLLASEPWAEQRGLPVLARLVDARTAAVDYRQEREGLLMAPAYAVPRLLDAQGLTLQDFDFYEIHEAFAAQVLYTLAAWESEEFCRDKLGRDAPLGAIDRARLNVKGSSLATGHPFAATGGRIAATLAKILNENGRGRGLISICAAGGQGVTAILERSDA